MARSEAIVRVRILEQSGQLWATPPDWQPVSGYPSGNPYVWLRAQALDYLKGDNLGPELLLLDGGGPEVCYNGGRAGPRSGVSVGDEAAVFLKCDGTKPKQYEEGCWVADAYIVEGGMARSPLNDKEMPAADLLPRIDVALAAAP